MPSIHRWISSIGKPSGYSRSIASKLFPETYSITTQCSPSPSVLMSKIAIRLGCFKFMHCLTPRNSISMLRCSNFSATSLPESLIA